MTSGALAGRGRAVVAALALAFTGAVLLRVGLAGPWGDGPWAAAAFAAVLLAAAAAGRAGCRVTRRSVAVGLLVAVVLVLPAFLHTGVQGTLPVRSFPLWAAATAVVATAEEAFLRGAFFDAVARWHSTDAAIVVAAVAFAVLHVPLYGWHVVPVDLAVGLVLGVARVAGGSWTSAAVAHVLADLAGWWLL
jgi:membrane protease YdiL (CAAX protease family)